MKILNEYPPNYAMIKTVFKDCEKYQAIFAYGDIIYNPFGVVMRPDLEAHEEVHSKQQGTDPDSWWLKYLSDKEFRLSQEIEAYGTQLSFAQKHVKDGKMIAWVHEKLSESLSGDLYGNLIGRGEAEVLLKRYAKRNPL